MSQAKDKELGGDFVRLLAGILKESELTEIEYETETARIKVSREQKVVNTPFLSHVNVPSHAEHSAPLVASDLKAVDVLNTANAVKSPLVGTAYRSSSPGSPFLVEVGQTVKEGDTLLIIEAMKVMNPIKAPKAGVVKQILVEDNSPVEYGEILMVIE